VVLKEVINMATSQYHEPANEMKAKTRDFVRVMQSMIEEAEAINWYQQRIEASKSAEVKKLLAHAQEEEFEHFSMSLEWVGRYLPKLGKTLSGILFKKGDIVKNAKAME
jgi:hypothetical protein